MRKRSRLDAAIRARDLEIVNSAFIECLPSTGGRRLVNRVTSLLDMVVAPRSELVLKPELHDARIRRGQDLSERRAAQRGVRIARPQPVEGIECLDARLYPLSTANPEQPHEREVDAPAARAQVGVVARIPVGADRR